MHINKAVIPLRNLINFEVTGSHSSPAVQTLDLLASCGQVNFRHLRIAFCDILFPCRDLDSNFHRSDTWHTYWLVSTDLHVCSSKKVSRIVTVILKNSGFEVTSLTL